LHQEISHLMNAFSFKQNAMIVVDYEDDSLWANLAV